VAVWKRIEKAKATLKDSLLRSGMGAFAPCINGVFLSILPASAPAGLVSEALIAKAALLLAPAAPGAGAAVGGIAMTAKGVSLGAVSLVSLLLFLSGMGGGYLIKASPRREEAPPGSPLSAPGAGESRADALAASPPARSTVAMPGAESAPRAPKEPLLGQLQALAQLFRNQTAAAKRRDQEPALVRGAGPEVLGGVARAADPGLRGAGDALRLLRAPENKDIFTQLLLLLGDSAADDGTKLRYPPAFIDALKDLISTGTKGQRREVAGYVTAGIFGPGGAGRRFWNIASTGFRWRKTRGCSPPWSMRCTSPVPRSSTAWNVLKPASAFSASSGRTNPHWSVRGAVSRSSGRVQDPGRRSDVPREARRNTPGQ